MTPADLETLLASLRAGRDECDAAARSAEYPDALRVLWQGRALGLEIAMHAVQMMILRSDSTCSASERSDVDAPLLDGELTLLREVDDAARVLVCTEGPAEVTERLRAKLRAPLRALDYLRARRAEGKRS